MRSAVISTFALTLALACTSGAFAQNKKDAAKWDVNAPPLPIRNVPINVDEGTWMNLDVSPDGQTIAFDLLGDIYTIPITGGTPTRIAKGLAFEVQPRFSPDGQFIAFTSDRGGGDNIWVMRADGSEKRQITKEQFRLLNNPTWSADGQYIAARKHFTTQRSAGTGEIWLYHIGGGEGVALVKRPSPAHQKELGEPMFTPDGKAIYFSKNATPGPIFEYAQDSNTQLFVIDRYDMASGETERVTGGPGGAVRPSPSPDGKWLAFVRRERAKSKLYIKDLSTGEERKIYDDLDQDMQETWAIHGVYPNMDWTPDSGHIVFWAGGKIRKIAPQGGNATIIPFKVSDERSVIDPVRPQKKVWEPTFQTRIPRFASLSPDGSQIAFESLGNLYVKPASGGAARQILAGTDGRIAFPSWSPNSTHIIFVRWSDDNLGTIQRIAADGSALENISTAPGHYRRPVLSPDRRYMVYEAGSGGFLTSDSYSQQPGIYLMDMSSGQARRISSGGSDPHFGADNSRIFMSMGSGDGLKLVSVDLNGKDVRSHASGQLVSGYSVSPNGKYLAFAENYSVFLMPFMAGNVDLGAGAGSRNLPVKRLSDEGAQYIRWSKGGDQVNWSLGSQFYAANAGDIIPSPVNPEPKFTPPENAISLAITANSDAPGGMVALTNARIITMADKDGGIIPVGTVLIENNRIKAVGANIAIPASAKQVDLAGKTIIPGLIDAHAHGPQASDDVIPQQNWSAIAHLALGVTTIHDPSNAASHIFAAAEYQKAGSYLAPRIFSTGEIVYGAKAAGFYAEINSLEDARDHVRRLKAQGAHAIKNYNQPRRDQRQQVVKAAIEENIATVAEGGSQFNMDIALIADGNTTLEHNIPQAVLYEDVIDFFAATKVGYTPTLVVTYGGPAAQPYWRGITNVWEHPILSAHAPPKLLQAGNVRREIAPEDDYADTASAREAAKLLRRGVPVSIGAHGQQQGLAAHWEIWSFVKGGMTPLEALSTATIVPARSLGFDRDIGSLEVGKLADMVIIDGDPLTDIRDSDNITHVMLNGRLYNAVTMNEEVTGQTKRKPYFWE